MKRNFNWGRTIARINRSMLLREAEEQMQQDQMAQMDNGADMSGMENEMADDAEIGQATPQQMGMGGEEEDMPMEAQAVSENQDADTIVSQIREMALQGLQTLANDIDDPAYDLFKKVWLMCDKAQTPEEGANQNA